MILLDYKTVEKFRGHGGWQDNRMKRCSVSFNELSKEELSFANFCYSMWNACFYAKVNLGGKVNDIANLENQDLKEVAFSVLLRSVEEIVRSWIITDAHGLIVGVDIPEKKPFDNEFGFYYANVVDFVLLNIGYKRSNDSTVEDRKNVGRCVGKYKLVTTNVCLVSQIKDSIENKIIRK